jgi:hypothetical protein
MPTNQRRVDCTAWHIARLADDGAHYDIMMREQSRGQSFCLLAHHCHAASWFMPIQWPVGQPLRYVLADDPGAVKTIMAGLFIRELLMRADAKRVLIVAPGSLEQWQDEMFEKFGLRFNGWYRKGGVIPFGHWADSRSAIAARQPGETSDCRLVAANLRARLSRMQPERTGHPNRRVAAASLDGSAATGWCYLRWSRRVRGGFLLAGRHPVNSVLVVEDQTRRVLYIG